MSVASLERRLSGIAWHYRQLGEPLDAQDRHIATVLAGIRRAHGRPPCKRRRSSPTIFWPCWPRWTMICADCATAPFWRSASPAVCAAPKSSASIAAPARAKTEPAGSKSLAPPRGRARQKTKAGRLQRENEGGSDVSRAEKEGGLLLTINGKTGWREVEIGRGSSALTCPVAMLETWMRLGRIADGPLFRRVTKKNAGVTSERLTDKHVARLVQKTALAAGIRGDLSEGERKLAFSGHSLRAGLASSAKIEEAHVQRHLGHASAEMTRRYQRKRDRFKVNLTKAAGL